MKPTPYMVEQTRKILQRYSPNDWPKLAREVFTAMISVAPKAELLEADLIYLREWLEAERDGRAKYTGTIQRDAAFEQALCILSKFAKHKGPQS